MKKFFQMSNVKCQMSAGFTLIEMLVTIAIIAIISGVVIVGISPAKRITDAQDSRAKQDVRAAASAVEACLSYADAAGTTNTAAWCAVAGNLTGATQGAPFARALPNVSLSTSSGYVCIKEVGGSVTAYYSTATGKIETTAPAGC